MTTYNWVTVFSGETLEWGVSEGETVIEFSGGTILKNPIGSTYGVDEQVVTIGGNDYDLSVNYTVWESLWDWAVNKANFTKKTVAEEKVSNLDSALESYVISE